ncbi:MAG: DUF262 domain-containing protein [Spirochaetales bacterium]|nr:DUF262 domain-containing protein [Spirochaetales bacterium]
MTTDMINISQDTKDISEDLDESSSITKPFDPNQIKIETQQMTLYHIIDRVKHNEINFYTEFQRRPDLWDDTKQSRLIESIFLKLPIPSFYFDGKDDDKWDIVDGLQRIYTLKKFVVDKTLKLVNLQFLKQFDDATYDDLPRDLHRRIDKFPIVVSIIQKGTPDDVKFILFSRINTGGLILTPQEIRHALHQGIPANFVKELAETEEFKQTTDNKIKPERMEDRYYITRFISFYLDRLNYQPELELFLSKGIAKINSLSNSERKKMKEDFIRSMKTAFSIFDKDAFRKRLKAEDPRKPINKALFDALSVNFARLTEDECKLLIKRKDIFKEKMIKLMNDSEFYNSISYGTAFKTAVDTRHSEIEKIIRETLKEKHD